MSSKTIKITYWILIVLFAVAMLGDAFGGITMQKQGVDVLNHVGFPLYMMPFMGYAKLLGAIALLQTKFRYIKEWAFAGFAFSFTGAAVARISMGDGAMIAPPLIMLAVLFITYFFWNKYEALKMAN